MRRGLLARAVLVAGMGAVAAGAWLVGGPGAGLIAGGVELVLFGLVFIDVGDRG